MDSRCPDCNKLVAVLSDDFAGDVALFCQRCKQPFGSVTADLPRLQCRCRKWVASGIISTGWVRTRCDRCGMLVELWRGHAGEPRHRVLGMQPRKGGKDTRLLTVELMRIN